MSQIPDGIALMYVKDGKVLPVAITESERQMIELFVAGLCKPLKVINKPIGDAINLVEAKKE